TAPAAATPLEQAKPAAEAVNADVVGLDALKAREPAFDIGKFLDGARDAYATIVRAFSSGDRGALKSLFAPAMNRPFEAAITQGEAKDHSQSTEFLHPPRADLDRVEVTGDTARARVR